jgi:succinate dehydrogenase hydrophobic anchor subunit
MASVSASKRAGARRSDWFGEGPRPNRTEEGEMTDGWALAVVMLVQVGVVVYLVGSLIRQIRKERRVSNVRKIWANFGLGLTLCILFFTSWVGQAVAEWQVFKNDQVAHGEPVELGDYLVEFSQSTMENWQSEFLQLFSFVLLSALLIHRGSGESRDSDERIEHALQRIEEKLGSS